MDTNEDVQKFLQVHPKYSAEPVSDEIIERYINVCPDLLLKFWKEHGFGTYGSGFIQFINPDDYREVVNTWLMRADDGMRIPFAISAFGDVFYWRHIHNPNPSEDFPEWVFDVSYFNPHNSETGLCAYSMGEFFGEYIVDSEIVEAFKWPYHSGYPIGVIENQMSGNDETDTSLFSKALKKLGVLGKDEMYFFVPALRLGGIDDIEYVEKGNAVVHLDILFQLTGEETYDPKTDMYDYYIETEKLGGNPAEYDRRIEELKAELNGEDDAYTHYMIAKLLDQYPYYHESIQNSHDVQQRTKSLAKVHHDKAKELDPENPKYFYAAFDSVLSDYDRRNWGTAPEDLEKYYELSGDEHNYLRGRYDIAYHRNNDDDVLDFSEKIYQTTGSYSDLTNAASYFQYKGNYDKALEINRRIFDEADEYFDVKIAARGITDALKEKNMKEEALIVFDEMKNRFPEYEPDILNETGMFLKSDYKDKNRLDKSIGYFQNAAAKGEEQYLDSYEVAGYYFNLYSAYDEKEDFENARTAIEKASELSEDSFYNDEKARLLYKMGLEDEAKETFTSSTYSDPNFAKKFDDGNWQEVVWGLESSPSAFDRKIEKIEAELEADPSNAEKQFLLGKLYENYPVYMMDADGQEDQYSLVANAGYVALCEATELDEQNPVYQLHLAEFIYHNHYRLEMDDEDRQLIMEDAYQFYIDHADNPYEGYEGLKKMAQYEDDWESIIKYAKLAYETKPEMTHELLDLGNAYTENGQYQQAVQAYQEFLLAETDFYQQLNGKQGLAMTYIKSGEPGRAESLLEDVAKSAESDQERYEVYEKAADAFRITEDLDNALKFQEKAVYFAEKTGDMRYVYPTALLELSSLYELKGNLKEAIALAQKNCNLRGDDYDYSRLGYLLKENNQPNEARAALKKALEINPDDQYTKDLLEELGDDKGGGFFKKFFG